jgi:hypothetical protein
MRELCLVIRDIKARAATWCIDPWLVFGLSFSDLRMVLWVKRLNCNVLLISGYVSSTNGFRSFLA